MADIFLIPCYIRIMRGLQGRLLPGTAEYRGEKKSMRLPRIRRAA